MAMTLRLLADQIARAHARWGDRPQPAATPHDVRQVASRFQTEFGVPAPEEYLELLRLTDGALYNGIEVFACKPSAYVNKRTVRIDGIMEANRRMKRDREEVDGVAIFATQDMGLRVLDLATGVYKFVGHGGDDYEQFDSFTAMLSHAFANRLPKDVS
jgi:hypothetical protein